MLSAVDLFCGAGGTSSGAEATGGVKVRHALNHWDRAIQTHSANFRECHHFHARLDQVHPREVNKIDILYASPECTHHSNARGAQPMDDQSRCQATDVLKWVEYHRPTWGIFENVREFMDWGPLGDNGRPLERFKGKLFDSWLMTLRNTGYRVDYRLLNAADFGAATSRTRLFVIIRKGGRRIEWPEPTHIESQPARALPGMSLPRWRSAADIIDWSLPCPSIFTRKRPLQPKTLSRIEIGLRKFVAPFQLQLIGRGAGRQREIDKPVPTIVAARENHGIVIPFVVQWDNHRGNGSYSQSVGRPIGTLTTKANRGIVLPYLVSVNHGDGKTPRDRCYSIGDPLQTLTTHRSFGVAVPFLASYYGTDNTSGAGSPVPTITTVDRHALCLAHGGEPAPIYAGDNDATKSLKRTMRELGVFDIGFRMLSNPELALAQGFAPSYVFVGGRADVTKQIGNSVSPPNAQAITQACLGA